MPPNTKGTLTWGRFALPAAAATATISSAAPYTMSASMTAPAASPLSASTPTSSVDERLLDAKLQAVEARTETKFAQLLGKLDLMANQLGSIQGSVTALDTRITTIDTHVRSARLTIIAAVVGTGIAVAALAWGGIQIFQGGMGASASAFQAGLAAGQNKSSK